MKEIRGMGQLGFAWKQVSESKIPMDLVQILLLGAVAYLLFQHAVTLSPAEGALLIMVGAGLLRTGIYWWEWHRRLTRDGSLVDWVQRILQGEREPQRVSEGLSEKDHWVAGALNDVIEDLQGQRSELADLRHAMIRDWQELDTLLEAIQHQREAEAESRLHLSQLSERKGAAGRPAPLKSVARGFACQA